MRKKYPDDLTDQEWQVIEPLFRRENIKRGRPLKYGRREILNAIFYVLRTGCQWRHLPHDFPPWRAVYVQYDRWKKAGLFEKMNAFLRQTLRKALDRKESPSAAIADSQSVKTTEKGALKAMMRQRKSKEENVIYWLTLKDF
jgi:putative transposase